MGECKENIDKFKALYNEVTHNIVRTSSKYVLELFELIEITGFCPQEMKCNTIYVSFTWKQRITAHMVFQENPRHKHIIVRLYNPEIFNGQPSIINSYKEFYSVLEAFEYIVWNLYNVCIF